MKKAIFLFAFVSIALILACNQKPTPYENNWVEVTDTVNLPYCCMSQFGFEFNGVVINSIEDYRQIWEQYQIDYPLYPCPYNPPDVDFLTRTVLGYCVTGLAQPPFTKNIHKNDMLKQYRVLINLNFSSEQTLFPFTLYISIPKIPLGYSVQFDTTMTNVPF